MPWMTMPVALAIAGGTSAASAAYATKRAGSVNDKAIRAQQEESRRNADLEREDRAAQERLYLAALDQDRQRWADYTRIMTPHWQVGSSALSGLYSMAGLPGGAPTSTPGMPPSGMPSGPTAAGGPMAASAPTTTGPAYLNALPTGYGRASAARRQPTAPQTMPMPGMGNSMSTLGQLMALASQAGAFAPSGNLSQLPLAYIPRI